MSNQSSSNQQQSGSDVMIVRVICYQEQLKVSFSKEGTVSQLMDKLLEKLAQKNILYNKVDVHLVDDQQFELDLDDKLGAVYMNNDIIYLKKKYDLLEVIKSQRQQGQQVASQIQPSTSSVQQQQQASNLNQIQATLFGPTQTSQVSQPVQQTSQSTQPQPSPVKVQQSASNAPVTYQNAGLSYLQHLNTAKLQQLAASMKVQPNMLHIQILFPQCSTPNQSYPFCVNQKSTLLELTQSILQATDQDVKGFNISLYSVEGIPLSSCLNNYSEKLVHDSIADQSTIYCIFNLSDLLPTYPDIDSSQGPDQIFLNYQQSLVIHCDLSNITGLQLKQKAQHKTRVPVSKQQLYYGGKPINDQFQLQEYQIQKNSTIQMNIRFALMQEPTSTLYQPGLKHSVTQTQVGIQELRSVLSVIRKYIKDNNKTKYLGLVRDFSNNNAPLLHALNQLLRDYTLNFCNQVALEEGLLTLFGHLITSSGFVPSSLTPDKLFEHSHLLLGFLFQKISGIGSMPKVWVEREVYDDYEVTCPLTFVQIKVPVKLLTDKKEVRIVDYEQIKKNYLDKSLPVPGIASFRANVNLIFEDKLNQVYALIRSQNLNMGIQFWKQSQLPFQKAPESNSIALQDKWIDTLTNYCKTVDFLKIYSPLDISSTTTYPCLTKDSKNQILIYKGPNKEPTNPFHIYDVLKDQETQTNAANLMGTAQILNQINSFQSQVSSGSQKSRESMYQKLKGAISSLGESKITREPSEAIIVVFDISGSMEETFSPNLQRIGAVKAFFQAFADRTIAYNFTHIISLIFFDSDILQVCDFTENIAQFKSLVDLAFPRYRTALYDAIDLAIDKLMAAKTKFHDLIPRIIALTDGEDNSSAKTANAIAKRIIENKIVMDSFVVGEECEDLKSVTLASGGKCFFPKTLNDGIKLFEVETILRAGIRKELYQNEIDLSNLDQLLVECKGLPFSQTGHEIKRPIMLQKPVVTIEKAINNNIDFSNANQSIRQKRIMKEITLYNQNPHPRFSIYPLAEDFTFWKVLLMGPKGTPYQDGVFILYVEFPQEYPQKPPMIRFLTEIYHCNINSLGRICHSVLDRNYMVDVTMKQIFDCIYGLLLTPEPEDPLDSTIASEFLTDLVTYQKNAKNMTQQKALINLTKIYDSIIGQNDPEASSKKKSIQDWIMHTQQLD